MPVFPGPVCRHLHFPKSNNICHFSDHLTNLSMSSCQFCLSPISLTFLNSLVSSANFNILPVTPSSKSFMYTKNKIVPSTDTCGTPLKTDFQLETSRPQPPFVSYMLANCLSSWLYCFPYHVILTYILVFGVELYQMLSENLNSLHLPATNCRRPIIHPFRYFFQKKTRFVRHDFDFRNPCWAGFINLCLMRKSTIWSLIIVSNNLHIGL